MTFMEKGGIHLTQAMAAYSILGYGNLCQTHGRHRLPPESAGVCNRRTSRSRGMLFYRLIQQAVATTAVPYRQLVDGNDKIWGPLASSGYPPFIEYKSVERRRTLVFPGVGSRPSGPRPRSRVFAHLDQARIRYCRSVPPLCSSGRKEV